MVQSISKQFRGNRSIRSMNSTTALRRKIRLRQLHFQPLLRNNNIRFERARNVCVIGIIRGLTVKPAIDQRGSRPEGRLVTTRIHDRTRHFSFRKKSCISKIFSLARNYLWNGELIEVERMGDCISRNPVLNGTYHCQSAQRGSLYLKT
jgi:hypothetical protein